ncbi:MAG: VWA domain-containing protein [Gammaproteobacteria bacterium]|nr:VWA domain-containing protein [Gammaproteobacteria bacterium]
MARKRRQTEIFSMAFLDCMSCGFGAVILFFMIINSHVNATTDSDTTPLMAETNRLEIEILEGRKNLALARNTKQKLETELEDADSQIAQIIALIQELQAELDKYDNDTLAKIERVEKLQSDIKSLEEEIKRLLALKKQQDAAGEQIRTFKGEGDRQYLTGLKLGGQRTLILVDRSASMLSDKLINVLRRRNLPEAEQLRSRKWRQVVASVDWLTSQFAQGSEYQIYMFNNKAEPVIKGSEGIWLKAEDDTQLNEAVRVLRRTVPKNGTNMHAAFRVAKELSPRPDNIILLVDGMPTMEAQTTSKTVVSSGERGNIFAKAVRELPSGVPVNILLYPMEGDLNAPISFWSLALTSRGSFVSVSRDWP